MTFVRTEFEAFAENAGALFFAVRFGLELWGLFVYFRSGCLKHYDFMSSGLSVQVSGCEEFGSCPAILGSACLKHYDFMYSGFSCTSEQL